jgi:hypothetical protein
MTKGESPVMMTKSMFLIALFCLAVSAAKLPAEEAKYGLKSSAATVKDVLAENLG